MASDLLDKLKKNSRIKSTSVLTDSVLFNKKDMATTKIPILNVALGGSIDAGLSSGLTVVAGPSKHFKSLLALMMASAYLDKYKDACLMLYDSEFGITPEYLTSLGIDPDRVLHAPIMDVEELKMDLTKQLNDMSRKDKLVIIIDSIGNLASKKELTDAIDGKIVGDMSRAKQLKSFFRIVTPHLTIKDIPMIAINHTYDEIGLYPKQIMSGGKGITYSANTVFFMGRQQEKKGTEIEGYNFILNVEKSRFVKEKSKLPISITFEDGINRWSGLLELALEMGWAVKPNQGWYQGVNKETGEILFEDKKFRKDATANSKFWLPILKLGFADDIETKFKMGSTPMIDGLEEDVDFDEVTDGFTNGEYSEEVPGESFEVKDK